MAQLLRLVLGFALGNFIVSLFTALGISIGGYLFISDYLNQAFSYMESIYSDLPSSVIAILSIAGIPEAISILGSAIMTSGVFFAARVFIARS